VKIVHLITDLDVGGAEKMLARLIARLDPCRIKNTVISLTVTGTVGHEIQQTGVPVFALGLRPGRVNTVALWRLVALLRRLRPDVVQTWLYHADLAGLVAGALAHRPKIVWNIRCADLDPADHPRSLPLLLRTLAFLSRYPAAIICNSTAGRHAHENLGYKPRRWETIPNGFDTGVFRPCADARVDLRRELGLDAGAPVVGLLARFHPMKDHATFLRAATIVAQSRADVHFVAAGRGVAGNPVLDEMVADLMLSDRVHLLPERNDAPRFLAALDVAVSSSFGEAFPNVVGEAMACGTPCVVTNVGDSAQIVGDAGVMVPPRDAGALAAGVLSLLALDPASRDNLRVAARERIKSRFSLAGAAARYEQFYLDIAGQPPIDSTEQPLCAG
jgi:glycosyltransferase involved in cell wall biosynthesis